MSEDLNKRHKAALDVALMDLDVAAIPTKSDVFVRCGTGARDLHDAITDLRQRLQAAEERAEKVEGAVKAALHELRAPWPGDGCVKRARDGLDAVLKTGA